MPAGTDPICFWVAVLHNGTLPPWTGLVRMSPPGLKEACKHAESLYRKTRSVRVYSDAGTDLAYSCGEYPVMTQWGYADERGHFDHWGAGHIHTFPNEGSAHGTVVMQPGDIVILPYCRYVADPVKLTVREGHVVSIEGGLDAKLMRDWLADGSRRKAILVALNLLPFAAIAFLWFIGVVRDRIGEGEDRLFATVFLGSGLLFIAMLFAGGAVAGRAG